MSGLKQLRSQIDRLKGRQDQLLASVSQIEEEQVDSERLVIRLEKASVIIQEVAKATQKELEYHISELVTLALKAVFPDPYEMHLDFVTRRNKTEADLSFSLGEETGIDPMTASGGGAVDVAAFGLRVSSWSLSRPHTRAVLLLDEPFRFLNKALQSKASLILKEISTSLGLQMIIVTHEENLLDAADRIFETTQQKGVSRVKMISAPLSEVDAVM